MGWADVHIAKLRAGEVVQFRPHGNSMEGRISDGQLVTVAPFRDGEGPEIGDILLCKVRGRQLVHLVTSTRENGQVQISNNKGHVNGWIGPISWYGYVTKVED